MKRFSLTWWLAILPTSVVVGVPTFFLLGFLTPWGIVERIAAALVCAVAADVGLAIYMERIAPTKVRIGPGDRGRDTEAASEEAIVVSGFGPSSEGRVTVRGETWTATQCPDDTSELSAGMAVKVVDRVGLSLVVSAKSG